MTIEIGDIVRVPGYHGVHKPARLEVIGDGEVMVEGKLSLRIAEATRMSDKYCIFDPVFRGSFWAIERDGVQIFPKEDEK